MVAQFVFAMITPLMGDCRIVWCVASCALSGAECHTGRE